MPLNPGSPANLELRAEIHELADAVLDLSNIFHRRIRLMVVGIVILTLLVAGAIGTLFGLQGYYHSQENHLVAHLSESCTVRNSQAKATRNLINGILQQQQVAIAHSPQKLTKFDKQYIKKYTALLEQYNAVEGKPIQCQNLNQ